MPRYAFVANSGDNSVSTYVVDSATGRLKWIGKADAGTNPESVTVDPSGKYAYAANYGSNNVSQYAIGADGSLTLGWLMGTVAVAAAPSSAAVNPYSVTVDPSGKYAYVASSGDNTLYQFTVGADGSLAAMNVPAVETGTGPQSVTVDPSGRYVYVACDPYLPVHDRRERTPVSHEHALRILRL